MWDSVRRSSGQAQDVDAAATSDHSVVSPRKNRAFNIFGRRLSLSATSHDEFDFVPAEEVDDPTVGKFDEVWRSFSHRLCREYSKQLLSFAALKQLPEDILRCYEELEARTGIKIGAASQKLYYDEFMLKAAGSETLHSSEVEFLIQSKLGLDIGQSELQDILKQKLEDGGGSYDGSATETAAFDFELFASTLCEVLRAQKSNQEGSEARSGRFGFDLPLDPESFGKQAWDVLCLLLLLYCSFSVPYTIAFGSSDNSDGLSAFDISDIFIDATFMADIALSFVTAYDEQGLLVTDLRRIANNYLKTWFVPDFAGSFPFDLVITAVLEKYSGGSGSNLVGMKFIRMLKLIRAVKFVAKLNKLKHQEGLEIFGSLISLTSAVFLLIFSAHMLGCFFTLFIINEPDANWLQHYNASILDAPEWIRYVTALYWAIITLTTMGYGDITPVTNEERLFVIFVALFGAVIFSYTMGTVSSLISQVTGVDDRFQERLRTVLEYLQFREASPDLRRKVKNYYNNCWRRSAVPYYENEILMEVSTPIRAIVLRQIGACTKHDVPIFQGFDDECIGFIMSNLKRVNFSAGDILYQRGDIASEMYMVVEGSVKTQLGDGSAPHVKGATAPSSVKLSSTREVGRGETFGELALFPEIAGVFRPDSAVALSWGYAYTLPVDEMQLLEKHYPHVVQRLKELCLLRRVEYRMIDPSFDVKALPADKGSKRCKIRMCVEQLKADLLRCKEADALIPAAGGGDCEVVTLMFPVNGGDARPSQPSGHPAAKSKKPELQAMSCAVSTSGELLCIEHTVEGLSEERPRSLGYVVPSRSTLRVLTKEEVAGYGGWGKRQLFGCTLRVFPSPEVAAGGGSRRTSWRESSQASSFGGSAAAGMTDSVAADDDGTELVLLTWSQEDFASLRKTFSHWLRPSFKSASFRAQNGMSRSGSQTALSNVKHTTGSELRQIPMESDEHSEEPCQAPGAGALTPIEPSQTNNVQSPDADRMGPSVAGRRQADSQPLVPQLTARGPQSVQHQVDATAVSSELVEMGRIDSGHHEVPSLLGTARVEARNVPGKPTEPEQIKHNNCVNAQGGISAVDSKQIETRQLFGQGKEVKICLDRDDASQPSAVVGMGARLDAPHVQLQRLRPDSTVEIDAKPVSSQADGFIDAKPIQTCSQPPAGMPLIGGIDSSAHSSQMNLVDVSRQSAQSETISKGDSLVDVELIKASSEGNPPIDSERVGALKASTSKGLVEQAEACAGLLRQEEATDLAASLENTQLDAGHASSRATGNSTMKSGKYCSPTVDSALVEAPCQDVDSRLSDRSFSQAVHAGPIEENNICDHSEENNMPVQAIVNTRLIEGSRSISDRSILLSNSSVPIAGAGGNDAAACGAPADRSQQACFHGIEAPDIASPPRDSRHVDASSASTLAGVDVQVVRGLAPECIQSPSPSAVTSDCPAGDHPSEAGWR